MISHRIYRKNEIGDIASTSNMYKKRNCWQYIDIEYMEKMKLLTVHRLIVKYLSPHPRDACASLLADVLFWSLIGSRLLQQAVDCNTLQHTRRALSHGRHGDGAVRRYCALGVAPLAVGSTSPGSIDMVLHYWLILGLAMQRVWLPSSIVSSTFLCRYIGLWDVSVGSVFSCIWRHDMCGSYWGTIPQCPLACVIAS